MQPNYGRGLAEDMVQPAEEAQQGGQEEGGSGRDLPKNEAVIRVVGAVLPAQHDEWKLGKRYFSAGSLAMLERKRRW